MNICIGRPGYLIMDDMINSRNIETSCGNVSREKNRIGGGFESGLGSKFCNAELTGFPNRLIPIKIL